MIKLLDGTEATIRTYDSVKRTWNFSKTGKYFYEGRQVKYTVKFPAKHELTRTDGSIYIRDDWYPSTAIPEMGELSVDATKTDAEQEAIVKRKVDAVASTTER
jgi:hypothetical protein